MDERKGVDIGVYLSGNVEMRESLPKDTASRRLSLRRKLWHGYEKM
jgi:hypothetical protein